MHSRFPHTALTFSAALLAFTAIASTASAQEAPQPPPTSQVEVWSIEKTASLGRTIFLNDRAATRASDALLAHFNGTLPEGMVGWIVIPQNDNLLVRFLIGDRLFPSAGYDVLVDAQGRAGTVTPAAQPALTPSELTQFRARITAGSSFDRSDLLCAPRYNAVELYDPETGGWLVWLLASSTDPSIVPMGGHYRFRISPDGQTILKREALSASCLDITKRPQDVALLASAIDTPRPTEVHVFLSLSANLPIYASAGDRFWMINGASLEDIGTAPTRP